MTFGRPRETRVRTPLSAVAKHTCPDVHSMSLRNTLNPHRHKVSVKHSNIAAATARLSLDLGPVYPLHPLLLVLGLHEGCARVARLQVLVTTTLAETPMSERVLARETHVSRRKMSTAKLI